MIYSLLSNVLSFIDATRWKLDFYKIKIRFHIAFILRWIRCETIAREEFFEKFLDVKPSQRKKVVRFLKTISILFYMTFQFLAF